MANMTKYMQENSMWERAEYDFVPPKLQTIIEEKSKNYKTLQKYVAGYAITYFPIWEKALFSYKTFLTLDVFKQITPEKSFIDEYQEEQTY